MTVLRTKARGVQFSYEKAADGDVRIEYGDDGKATVSAVDWRRLILHFRGHSVPLGTSRTNPPPGSVGEWLQRNVTRTAIASYIGPILVHEGHAKWVDNSTLEFLDVEG
jgi:hypothetical protein